MPALASAIAPDSLQPTGGFQANPDCYWYPYRGTPSFDIGSDIVASRLAWTASRASIDIGISGRSILRHSVRTQASSSSFIETLRAEPDPPRRSRPIRANQKPAPRRATPYRHHLSQLVLSIHSFVWHIPRNPSHFAPVYYCVILDPGTSFPTSFTSTYLSGICIPDRSSPLHLVIHLHLSSWKRNRNLIRRDCICTPTRLTPAHVAAMES